MLLEGLEAFIKEYKKVRMQIEKIANKTTPLCYLPDGSLLCYHCGRIMVMRDREVYKTIPIKTSLTECLSGWSRMASRLLRFGVRASYPLDKNNVILSIGNYLYELNIPKGGLSKGWYCGEGIRPLILSNVVGVDSFEDGIYFGGYLGNMDKNPVNVYHRVGEDKWEVVYTFPKGAINHVHAIISDPYRNCLWVFSGDFDESAAIWKITDGFKKVECVVCNDQKYRGCVVFALPEGLLYATDAPFADDYIYLMDPQTYEVKQICPIDGSCIYGCQWKDKYVFSTTVEGDGRNTPKLEFLFGRKRGDGIKDDFVHMYMGNLKEGFREIYKEKKDGLPYYTFQFGVFKFPYGINNSDRLYFQPVATMKKDQDLMAYSE